MGDTKDASSIAAQRAQADLDTSTPHNGFWGRLFGQKPANPPVINDDALAVSAAGTKDMLLN
ncbi:MAG: hypothetical protein KAS85_03370, partial [Rhodobacteraceae bacterium]|nr:hypothetical protein [Paracoccaceae bacterium]